MIQTLKTTSEANDPINIECIKFQPFNSARGPFEFVEEDIQTGERYEYDITGLDFEIIVYENYNEILLQSSDLVKIAPNKLYLNLPPIFYRS